MYVCMLGLLATTALKRVGASEAMPLGEQRDQVTTFGEEKLRSDMGFQTMAAIHERAYAMHSWWLWWVGGMLLSLWFVECRGCPALRLHATIV